MLCRSLLPPLLLAQPILNAGSQRRNVPALVTLISVSTQSGANGAINSQPNAGNCQDVAG